MEKHWTARLSTAILISAISDYRITDKEIKEAKSPELAEIFTKRRASARRFFNPTTEDGEKYLEMICSGANISVTTMRQGLKRKFKRKHTQQFKLAAAVPLGGAHG